MLLQAVPLIKVSSTRKAETWLCHGLGFHLDFVVRGDADDPCYMGVSRDSVSLYVSSHAGDGVAGSAVNIEVDDVDDLHAEFVARGVNIDLPPIDQTWGTREMYVKDGEGNCLRFRSAARNS